MRPIASRLNDTDGDAMKKIMHKHHMDTVIQIEITNACNRSCGNCVRLCGNFPKDKLFYVDIKAMAGYLEAFRDFKGWVGFIGGEPTLHPQFKELCYILRGYRKKGECGIFTNCLTPQFKDNRELIEGTFGLLNYNDHTTNITHTPVLTASDEMVPDYDERMAYIDNCWLQSTWSATITPKGAYFCEVAGLMAWLFDGPDGWDPNDPDWWRRDVPDFAEQIAWACHKCGAALPLVPRSSKDTTDDISRGNLVRLLEARSPKVMAGKYTIYDKGFLPGQNRKRDWYWNK